MVASVPVDLSCNHLVNPLGVHDPAPGLSWRLSPVEGRRGLSQSAYRIQVGTTPGGTADLWDSGKVRGEASVLVRYGGRPLPSRSRAWWWVTVWDERGRAATSPTSPAACAFWETGLLAPGDWSAAWIGASWSGSGQSGARCPYLRRTFPLSAAPVRARLYVTALGIHESHLNGRRLGRDWFAPGWTDYGRRVQYQVFDVTAQLRRGENTFGAILGDGWYCGHLAQRGRQVYGDRPRFLAQLEAEMPDGSIERVVTDDGWQAAPGPILESDFLMGESYDARQELADWLEPEPKAGEWRAATVFPDPGIERSPMLALPVRVQETRRATGAPQRRPGWGSSRYVFDFGQNLVGVVTLKVKAPAGTTLTLRYAEMLDADGEIYTENLRTARSTDHYTCRGDPAGETWTPRFTFHGFRYAEVGGLPEAPGADALVAQVLHNDLPPTGTFVCSDPLVTQLQRNIEWGQRGNYLEVPTDCPQRDERLGWTGDAQAFIRTGTWNRHVAAFFRKWQRDIGDAQRQSGSVPAVVPFVDLVPEDGGPAWADAAIICPWTIYRTYGDRGILEAHYEQIRAFVDHLGTQTHDGIRCHPALGRWGGFGDWLALDGSGFTEGGTPKDLIGTAFHVHDARLMAAIATVLGRAEDTARYERLASRLVRAFQRRFVTADGLVAGNTQTSYVLALHFDLVPEDLRPKLVDELVREIERRGWKLSTGFVGTPYLMHVLTRAGRLDVAYRLLGQQGWPSWLYAVTQGATTIWERWDGWTKEKGFQTKGMNSFNHYAYGAVGDWLYAVVAGVDLDPEIPGFRRFRLAPQPGGGLRSAKGTLLSPHGEIASAWETGERLFRWTVTVPPNTRAAARFPVPAEAKITERGVALRRVKGVTAVAEKDGAPVCELASGRYRFTARW